MKRITILTLLFLTAFIFSSFAGDKYIWPEFTPTEIPDSVKKEDAIYLENRITVDFMLDYETSIVYFKRIKILSKKGVENFINHDLFQFKSGYISLKKARIIKPDNSFKELGGENIIETFIDNKNKYNSSYLKRIQFIFANLEVGDIIDVVYQIDYKSYTLSNCIYLEDDLISLNSRLSLRNFSKFELTVYPSKNLTDFVTQNSGSSPIFYWNIKGVGKRSINEFAAHRQNDSKVSYTLWYPQTDLSYELIYSNDYDSYHVNTGFKNFTEILKRDGVYQSDLSPFENINVIIRYFEKDFTWNTDEKMPASIKTSDCYNKEIIDDVIFYRLMQQYLDENELKYHIGFTRDINDGVFEHGFVALYQLDYRYLIIEKGEGDEHFLFSPTSKSRFYYLDEIPAACEGNQSILFTGNRDKVSTSSVLLPQSDFNSNKHTATIVLKTGHLSDTSIRINRRDSFTGQHSVLFRNPSTARFFKNMKVSDTILAPHELKYVYPYPINFKQEDTIYTCFSNFDENLYAFNAEKLIPSFIFFADETKEPVADYSIIPFGKQQKYSIYIESPNALKIADKVTSLVKSNSAGSVKTEIIQTDPNKIKINYEIKLEKRILSNVTESNEYLELVQEWANIVTKKWIIQEG
ncbi:DUF3858 domain-containing protein [Fluviicola taffensis]|uniref:DUF3857 domain-containing protein n=1 Tax=Fluviicola taffensis (strain DSM 16823 / NCIMB 13979 / RW262) TaxID=755732 RepID=F2I9N8_FLUTR|nr:DUF3857 domain-containing protein [Fluviicola taffensis]AEA43034.1 hypothetical protein Fluta_1036 [Fluviicola taffensis DSM 16823]